MAEDNFDKEIRDRLSGLEASPADNAWEAIEKELPKGKNYRPVYLLLLLFLLGVGGIGGYYFVHHQDNKSSAADTRLQGEDKPAVNSESGDNNLSGSTDGDSDARQSRKSDSEMPENTVSDYNKHSSDNNNPDDIQPVVTTEKPVAEVTSHSGTGEYSMKASGDMQNDRGGNALESPQSQWNRLAALVPVAEEWEISVIRDIKPSAVPEKAVEGEVYPRSRRQQHYLGFYLTPQWAYHRFIPDKDDQLYLTSLQSKNGMERTSIHAGFSYETYIHPRWSLQGNAGWLYTSYSIDYTYAVEQADSFGFRQENGTFGLVSVVSEREESITANLHYLTAGVGTFYTIDRDKVREHSIGLGVDYMRLLNSELPYSNHRLMGELSYRWSMQLYPGPGQQNDWKLQLGPVFRYQLSEPQEIAPGLSDRSYFIGLRAGLRIGLK